MAKKKTEESSADSYLDMIEQQINKDFGEGTFVTAQDLMDKKSKNISWGPAIDSITGGIPEGSTVTINGWFKTGKSSIALSLAANAQKPENGNKLVVYADVEGRLKGEKNLKGIEGLDLSPDKFRIIQSTQGKILTSQDYLKQLSVVLNTQPGVFVIVDSISALVDEGAFTREIGTSDRGRGQQTISQFVQNTSNVIKVMNSIVVYISHRIANTSGWGETSSEKIANRVLYQADCRLRIKASKIWLNPSKYPIGKIMQIECLESPHSMPPCLTIDSYLRFGKGIDRLMEIIQFGINSGLIIPKAAWYRLAFLKEDMLTGTEYEGKPEFMLNGMENVYQAFLKYPKWQEELVQSTKEFMNSLVGTVTEDKNES